MTHPKDNAATLRKITRRAWHFTLAVSLSAALLTSCGDDGGGDDDNANNDNNGNNNNNGNNDNNEGCLGDVICPALEPSCEGDVVVGSSGDGNVLADCRCDYSAVETRTDCAAMGQVCQEGACVRSFGDDPLTWPTDALGPFSTGYRTLEYTYESPGTGELQTRTLNVWYPSDAVEGARMSGVGVAFMETEERPFLNASLAPSPYSDGKYPAAVYSHGHLGLGKDSTYLTAYFASHGWVVVAPGHTGEQLNGAEPISTFYHRATDVSEALNALDALPEDDPLSGAVATERAFLTGHSRGTFTNWLIAGASFDMAQLDERCANEGVIEGGCSPTERALFEEGLGDERFAAVAPTAGTIRRSWHGDEGHASVGVPVMTLTGSQDTRSEQAAEQFDGLSGLDVTWIELVDACHQNFAQGFCGSPLDAEGTIIDTAEAFHIIRTYTLTFARRHVLGDESSESAAILDGSATVSDKARFERRTP